MGCDIHIICEFKENGQWKMNTLPVFKNKYYREGATDNFSKDEFLANPSIGRNYDLFAILANVRNGIGFAGVKTGGAFSVIAEPKGLPNDMSLEGKQFFGIRIDNEIGSSDNPYDEEEKMYITDKEAANWVKNHECTYLAENIISNIDYHSSSFLSVEEILNFDWTGTFTEKEGLITIEKYKELKDTGNAPDSWDYSLSGLTVITMEQANLLLSDGSTLPISHGKPLYVNYKWMVNYKEWFQVFIQQTFKPLCELKERFEDVRIVFSFDS